MASLKSQDKFTVCYERGYNAAQGGHSWNINPYIDTDGWPCEGCTVWQAVHWDRGWGDGARAVAEAAAKPAREATDADWLALQTRLSTTREKHLTGGTNGTQG